MLLQSNFRIALDVNRPILVYVVAFESRQLEVQLQNAGTLPAVKFYEITNTLQDGTTVPSTGQDPATAVIPSGPPKPYVTHKAKLSPEGIEKLETGALSVEVVACAVYRSIAEDDRRVWIIRGGLFVQPRTKGVRHKGDARS